MIFNYGDGPMVRNSRIYLRMLIITVSGQKWKIQSFSLLLLLKMLVDKSSIINSDFVYSSLYGINDVVIGIRSWQRCG
uniref:26S proteasome non-ATPase regulatory subunit 13 homolog B-like n=1 Tax=Rhizophora mucronata TaxID=61149 RepID=A0A2P2MUM8_RHIMU